MLHLKNRLLKYSIILALGSLPLQGASAAPCDSSETFKTFMEKQDYRGALQDLDKCLGAYEKASSEDTTAFDGLLKKLLTQYDLGFDDVYRNFQSVLAGHQLKGLEFELANYFEGQPDDDKKLFASVRKPEEKFYFYYDTGRLLPHSRGVAITNKSLLWKNFTGDPEAIAFNDIQTIQLIYELGMSLTGWKLQVNGNKDIRLSQVSDTAVISMVSAMIYFINANKDQKDQPVVLSVADREVAILAGWVTLCSEKYVDQQDLIKNLQVFDQCLVGYGKEFKLSPADKELMHKLTQQLLVPGKSLEDGYVNFKTVLLTHFFSDLSMKFKDGFNVEEQAKVFKDVRDPAETLSFYFETGVLGAGLALTDKALIWKNVLGTSLSLKNLTGSATRVPFDQITSVSLVHERDLTSPLSGWKIRLNDKAENEIALSKLSEDNVELFAQALVYLVNLTSGKPPLTLQLSNSAKDILTKSFLDRNPKIRSMTDSVLGIFGNLKEAAEKIGEEPKPAEEKPAIPGANEKSEVAPKPEEKAVESKPEENAEPKPEEKAVVEPKPEEKAVAPTSEEKAKDNDDD